MGRVTLFASASLLVLGYLTPATLAQSTGTGAAAAADGALEEIIVTAQRRQESAQKAALAIDAVTPDQLAAAGVTSAMDLSKVSPAISLTPGGGTNASIFLRGVGNISNSNWVDPAVTPNYDGVVLGRAGGAFAASFYDLQRVEVLKGPQGILYGRNATGGTFNIIPNQPELGAYRTGINLSYGNYDAIDASVYANVPVSDNSALRIAAMHQSHDGYNRDGSDDADRQGIRAQYLYDNGEGLSVRLAADYTHLGGVGAGESYLGSFTASGANSFTFTAAPEAITVGEGMNTAAANAYRQTNLGAPGFGFLDSMQSQQSLDYNYWGTHAELKLDTGLGELTVIPAYRKAKGDTRWYGPSFNTGMNDDNIDQYSLETRLAGDTGPVDYVVGAFYFNEKIDAIGQFNQEFVQPFMDYTLKTESIAAFGQLTYNVSDDFRLVGGLRYTHDQKKIDGLASTYVTMCGGAPATPPPASFTVGCQLSDALPRYPDATNPRTTFDWLVANNWIATNSTYSTDTTQVYALTSGKGVIVKTHVPIQRTLDFGRATWKLSGELDVSPASLLYATVETGYRAGGLQMAEGDPTYDPEFITAYSIGSKNRFLDNRLQVNLEAFWWEYRDQQITYFTVEPISSTLINSTHNVGRSRIRGLDADILAKVTADTTLNAQVQYLDTVYKDLTLYSASPFNNINCPSTATGGTLNDGTPIYAYNCSGQRLLYSPKWSINLGAEQVWALNQDLELVAALRTSWRSEQNAAFEFLDFERIGAYWTTDFQLTLQPGDGGWSVTGYVNNIEGNRHIARPQSSPIGFASASYTAPRTYGLRLTSTF